jgi:ubiquinone/menaquinone biosynthesis C-methylase UbiE
MSRPKGYVDAEYLQVAATVTEHVKRRSYALMRIRPGDRVLDVGCGPGTDTLALARLVGDSGQVVGVDYDQAMIANADRAATDANIGLCVKHIHADAYALPFEPGEFDSCRSERLFEHLCHPEQALSEMVRVAKPGGSVVLVDSDWGSGSIDSPHPDIERRVMRILTQRLNNPYSGRQLFRLFRQKGLSDLVVEGFCLAFLSHPLFRQLAQLDQAEADALSAGVVSSDELATWRSGLERAEADGAFFASCNLILVAGRTPGGRSADEAG